MTQPVARPARELGGWGTYLGLDIAERLRIASRAGHSTGDWTAMGTFFRSTWAVRLGLAAAFLAISATPALAGPGLPRTYDVTAVESAAPIPGGGGNFGWGVTSADLTGDGKLELLVAQSQDNVPGAIFIYDGATNRHIDTITPPERNPVFPADDAQGRGGLPNPGEALAFVYVEHVADLGSCPAGTPGGQTELCPDPRVGPLDGIPEIIAGSRALRVGTCPAGQTNCPQLGRTGNASDPPIGRAYVFDGKTRAVLKRIDMPLDHRQSQVARGTTGAAFGRLVMSPQGLAPCAGPAAEANNAGVGSCDVQGPEQNRPAVRIGDVDGIANSADPLEAAKGRADLYISTRGYRETNTPGHPNTAAGGSQCFTAAPAFNNTTSGSCSSGKAFMYRGEEISGTSTVEILDGVVNGQVANGSVGTEGVAKETMADLKNPFGQVPGQEFSGNMQRIGDVGRCQQTTTGTPPVNQPLAQDPPNQHRCRSPQYLPDGRPDFIVHDRAVDYPLASPDTTTYPDVGVAYLYDGATNLLLHVYSHPQPEARGGFTDSFNVGWPVGNIGHSNLPDFVTGASTQSVRHIGDGRGYIYNGEATSGRGAMIAVLDDPTPKPAGQFGSSQTGVGDLVSTPGTPNNEVAMGSYSPFGVSTEAAGQLISDVTIFNGITERPLQTIPDPVQERGSGFGVGMTPMGDLNGDGFLDFAISSYLSNLPGQPADGRAYIFRSNNRPLPPGPSRPGATISTPRLLRPGRCANDTIGTARADSLKGTTAGDRMFGFGGDDRVEGFADDDCLEGGTGADRLLGAAGADRLIGGRHRDRMLGGNDRDRLFGGSSGDRVKGGYGADLVAGGSGNDRLDGGPETDRVYGERGHDRIRAGGGRNILDGGSGNDNIFARNHRRDVIRCGSGRDRVSADRTDRVQVSCERIRRARR